MNNNTVPYFEQNFSNNDHPWPDFIKARLDEYFIGRVRQDWLGGHILKGRSPDEKSLLFFSNDYLNLSHHPRILYAAQEAIKHYGFGQMQSAVFLSNESKHRNNTEQLFATLLKQQDALLFQSGWCANIGAIQSLASKDVPVYLDFYAHMSFWEGVKSARAKAIPFKHNDLKALEQRLKRFGSGIIAIDTVYSTTGQICPIKDIIHLAKKYNCIVIADESHALGVFGQDGAGLCQEQGVSQDVALISASLAKAVSGRGGIVSGNHDLIEMMRYSAYPTIFSSALVPADLAGFEASLAIFRDEVWRKQRLLALADYLRESLLQEGIMLYNSQSHIIPLLCGSEQNTIWFRDELEKANIFGAVFCPPATPKNKSLIRISLNCAHQKAQLDELISTLIKIKKMRPDLPVFSQDQALNNSSASSSSK